MSSDLKTLDSRLWCLFRSESARFAVPLEAVVEIVAIDSLVALPLGPPCLLGLCTFRREVIPVVRLRRDSLAERESPATKSAILVLRTEKGSWAFKIERDGVVVSEGTTDLDSTPRSDGLSLSSGLSISRGEAVYAAVDPEAAWIQVRACVARGYGSGFQQGQALDAHQN